MLSGDFFWLIFYSTQLKLFEILKYVKGLGIPEKSSINLGNLKFLLSMVSKFCPLICNSNHSDPADCVFIYWVKVPKIFSVLYYLCFHLHYDNTGTSWYFPTCENNAASILEAFISKKIITQGF